MWSSTPMRGQEELNKNIKIVRAKLAGIDLNVCEHAGKAKNQYRNIL